MASGGYLAAGVRRIEAVDRLAGHRVEVQGREVGARIGKDYRIGCSQRHRPKRIIGRPAIDLAPMGVQRGEPGAQIGPGARTEQAVMFDEGDQQQPVMLALDRGEAMRWLTAELERRGFTWAYRVVDTQAFGLPQRRQRVLLLASREADPRPILKQCVERVLVAGDRFI